MGKLVVVGKVVGFKPNMEGNRVCLSVKEENKGAEEYVNHIKVNAPYGQTVENAPCRPHVKAYDFWVEEKLADKFDKGDEVEVTANHFEYRKPYADKKRNWQVWSDSYLNVENIKLLKKKAMKGAA